VDRGGGGGDGGETAPTGSGKGLISMEFMLRFKNSIVAVPLLGKAEDVTPQRHFKRLNKFLDLPVS
jgi:hypothetical protein